MDYSYFKKIISKFSKQTVKDFIGNDLYNALIEWSSDETFYTKSTLIDILVSTRNGFNLFCDEKFRKCFFSSLDIDILQDLLNSKSNNYGELADNASRIPLKQNDFYKKLFAKYLNSPDFSLEENFNECKQETVFCSSKRFFELLNYQYAIKEQAIYELNRKLKYGRKILIHMPTGTGKTKTTMHIITNYLNSMHEDGKNEFIVVWIAHTNELLKQALSTFKDVWGHLGSYDICAEKSWCIGDYCMNSGVLFITIESLMSLKKTKKDVYDNILAHTTLTIYDECHKIGARKTKEIVKDFTNQSIRRDFIGLTATPGRTTDYSFENQKFSEFFDRSIEIDIPLVNKLSMEPLDAANTKAPKSIIKYFQNIGVLSKLKKEELVYNVDDTIKREIEQQLNNSKENFDKNLIDKISMLKARNIVILSKLKELNANNVPTIVFACSVTHAKLISACLNLEKVPNSLVYGDLPSKIRDKAISDFKDKSNPINIIINYDILTTGFDSTNIQCVFITRPTKSVILYSQMIGRGLRGKRMGGNEECLLIDIKENLKAYDENKAFDHFNEYWR